MKLNEILVLPDVHAEPGQNFDRLTWAMEFALIRRPKIIIQLGDFADMGSLCSYDKGSLRAEGRRYGDDIDACKEALEAFLKPLKDYNKKMIAWKKTQYKPRVVFLIGNHEQRILRASEIAPEMHDHISLRDLGYGDEDIEVVPYLTPFVSDNVCFKHCFTSGVMGRPIGGENHAASLVKKGFMSCVAGHSHCRDFWESIRADNERVCGLVAGCYFEGDHAFTSENGRYWRGLVYLRDVDNGSFQPEFLTIDYLRRKFG